MLLEKDHCYDSPCKNNGTCINLLDGFLCTCLVECTGQNCDDVSMIASFSYSFGDINLLYDLLHPLP